MVFNLYILNQDPQEFVVFTTSAEKLYSDYDLENMTLRDTKLAVIFETQEILDESLILLRFNCPDSECPFIAKGWNDLKMHVKVIHKKMMW